MFHKRLDLIDQLVGRSLRLWGAGRWGRVLGRRLRAAGLELSGFLDARAEQMSAGVLGLAVEPPEPFLAAGPEAPGNPVLVITPQFFREAMLPLAEAAGFRRGHDLFVVEDFTPHHYIVEVSGRCNLRCLACPQGRRERRPGGLMSLADFRRVIAKIRAEDPLAANLQLYQWGEPLLNPELPAMMAEARELDLPVSISSNLNLELDLGPAAAGADWFRVSLSGCGPDYERTHAGGRWPKVRANLERLARAREAANPDLRVELYYHLYAHNQGDQLREAQRLCRELGFEFRPVWAYLIGLDEVLDYEEGRPLPPEARDAAELLALPLETVLAAARREMAAPCLVENVVMVDWDRSVPTCLMYFNPDRRLAGDYLELPLAELESRRRASELCSICRRRALHRYCDTCYNWPLPSFEEPG